MNKSIHCSDYSYGSGYDSGYAGNRQGGPRGGKGTAKHKSISYSHNLFLLQKK